MSRAREAASEFWRGFSTPSALALLATAIVTLCGLLTATVLISPASLPQGTDRFLIAGSWDEFLPVTSRALGFSDRDSIPLVLVLGGSVAKGTVMEAELQQRLRERIGREVEVAQLSTSRQTLWESIAIAEQLPTWTTGVAVIFVGPTKLLRGREEIASLYSTPKLGLRSRFVDEQARLGGIESPPLTGIYAVDNRLFYQQRLPHALRNVVKAAIGRELPESDYSHPKNTLTAERWDKLASQVLASIQADSQAMLENLGVLDSLISIVRRGTAMSIVLVESPINPQFVERFMGPRLYREYNERVRALAARQRVNYFEFPDLVEADFYDWAHIRSKAVAVRLTHALADTLPSMSESLGASRLTSR